MKKVQLSQAKYDKIVNLSSENHVIAALAIDQRGSLKKMMAESGQTENVEESIVEYKKLVSNELTKYASSILLDPEFGLPASKVRNEGSGLLLAYEVTGFDPNEVGRLPRILDDWSAYRLNEAGADALKFLLYYDVDEPEEINEYKHIFMERVGQECKALDLPFFLEIITYDAGIEDSKGAEFAKVKPRKVIESMKEFSKEKYQVDVLKMEVPVNMNFVEGFTQDGVEAVYSREEALAFYKEQSDASHIPFIFLSAGVSMELFNETIRFAKEAGSTFNGVLCGRATWKDSVDIFVNEGEEATLEWLRTQGKANIEALNEVLAETAQAWDDKIEVI